MQLVLLKAANRGKTFSSLLSKPPCHFIMTRHVRQVFSHGGNGRGMFQRIPSDAHQIFLGHGINALTRFQHVFAFAIRQDLAAQIFKQNQPPLQLCQYIALEHVDSTVQFFLLHRFDRLLARRGASADWETGAVGVAALGQCRTHPRNCPLTVFRNRADSAPRTTPMEVFSGSLGSTSKRD